MGEGHFEVGNDALSTQSSDAQLISRTVSKCFDDQPPGISVTCRRLADIRLFTALLCLLACVNGAISASYLPSVITAIEKRFELSSITTGLIVASYEVGAIVAVIFVSYLGNQENIPRILGVGTLLVGIGTCLFALPHFIATPYSKTLDRVINNTADNYCSFFNTSSSSTEEICDIEEEKSGNEIYTFIFMVSQALIGIGSTPILTLGLSYIDNHVSKKSSPQYLGKFTRRRICDESAIFLSSFR